MEVELDSREGSFKTALGGLMVVTVALLACATAQSITDPQRRRHLNRHRHPRPRPI